LRASDRKPPGEGGEEWESNTVAGCYFLVLLNRKKKKQPKEMEERRKGKTIPEMTLFLSKSSRGFGGELTLERRELA